MALAKSCKIQDPRLLVSFYPYQKVTSTKEVTFHNQREKNKSSDDLVGFLPSLEKTAGVREIIQDIPSFLDLQNSFILSARKTY
jgi:hypothetical protein